MAFQTQSDPNPFKESPLFQLEAVFSRVADNLFLASEKATSLRTSVTGLVQVINPDQLTKMSHGREELASLSQTVDDRIAQSSDFIDVMGKNRRRMNARLKELAQNIHSAGIVSLNARIIAQGHRTLQQGEQLVRLAESISGITDNASAQVSDMLNETDLITNALIKLSEYTEAEALTLADRTKPDLNDLSQAYATLETGMAGSHKPAQWLMSFFAKAEGDVVRVIEVLQIGDRSRQRAEHIQQILHEAGSFGTGSVEAVGLTRLAEAQMAQAAHDTLEEADKAHRVLTDLRAELRSYQASRAEIQTAFASAGAITPESLDGTALQAKRVQLTHGDADAHQFVKEITDCESTLQEHSKKLGNSAFAMQLTSLNTIIACAREGRAAADMIVISQQVNEVVSTVPEIFDDFTQALESTKTRLSDFVSVPAEDAADDAPIDGLDVMPALIDALHDLMPRLSSDADQLARAIETCDMLISDMVRDLQKCAKQAERAAGSSVWRPRKVDDRLHQVSDRIRNIYTMEAERQLHDQILGHIYTLKAPDDAAHSQPSGRSAQESAQPAAPTPAATDSGDLSDILF